MSCQWCNTNLSFHPACSDPWTNQRYGSSAHRCNLHSIVITRTAQIMQIFQNRLLESIPFYQSNNHSSVYFPYIYEWLCFPGLSHKLILWKRFISVCEPKMATYLSSQETWLLPWLIHLTLIKKYLIFLYLELNIKKEQLYYWSTILEKNIN